MRKAIDPSGYPTDKPGFRIYFENYERAFEPFLDQPIKLLELGVKQGGSLQLWRDYFPSGEIVGLDITPVQVSDTTGRLHVYTGMQQDTALLDRIAAKHAPAGFDIIIDDCAHIGEFSEISFWHLFEKHLKPGGIYVIEDWGTGYWGNWADGRRFRVPRGISWRSALRPIAEKLHEMPWVRRSPWLFGRVTAGINHLVRQKFASHHYGLVGFIKQLVDECGMGDITAPEWGVGKPRRSRFHAMQISPGQVFVFKARPGEE